MSDFPEPTAEEAEEAPEIPFVAWEPSPEDVPEDEADDSIEDEDETVVGSRAHRNLADTLAAAEAARQAETG